MRQKLAICCAYLYDPDVLLLDEPLTGLDPPGIRSLLESVSRRAQSGVTVIISSHLLAMIEDVCTHLLVMQDGRAQYFGDANQLRIQYPNASSLEEAYFEATQTCLSENGMVDRDTQESRETVSTIGLTHRGTLDIDQHCDGAAS